MYTQKIIGEYCRRSDVWNHWSCVFLCCLIPFLPIFLYDISYSLSTANQIQLLSVLWMQICLIEQVAGWQKHGSIWLLQKPTYLEISAVLSAFNLTIPLRICIRGADKWEGLSVAFSKTLKQRCGQVASLIILLNKEEPCFCPHGLLLRYIL